MIKKSLIISLIILSLVLVGCNKQGITGGTTTALTCQDSDGGLNTDVKGIVYVEGKDYADACITGLLIEYYCDGNKLANQNIRCPNECSNGKCI